MQNLACLSCLAITASFAMPAIADSSVRIAIAPTRLHLQECAWQYHWPGGALFHTAFHGGRTTRFLLLKASSRSESLKSFLDLTEDQLQAVQEMKPVDVVEIHTGKWRVEDPNAEPDEQALDPDYYSFLKEEQLLKLDLVALRYDGYWALTRGSLATSAQLAPATKLRIAEVVARFRENFILPRFRWAFAAALPKDYFYEEALVAGSVATHVNRSIMDILTDAECDQVSDLIRKHEVPEDVLTELRKMAELPHGMDSLNAPNEHAE